MSNLVARLLRSPVFVVAILLVCTVGGGYGAGLLTQSAGTVVGLAMTGILALFAIGFAFGSLEMYLLTGLAIAIAAMFVSHSPWLSALPGALGGFAGTAVLFDAMGEWSKRNGDFLQIIPTDPLFVPSPEAWTRARRLLEFSLPLAEEISYVQSVETRFFYPEAGLGGVECPFCGRDLLRWWRGTMSRASARGFKVLEVVTPCCHTGTTLNDLRYEPTAGFARFVTMVRDPGRAGGLTDAEIQPLENALGCKLRQVWARGWDPALKAWRLERRTVG